MEKNLVGKVVVITGASSGFGRGAALAFVEKGAGVVVAARREFALEELVTECRALGGTALSVPTDVSIQDDVVQLAKETMDTFGRIDIWINNAGASAVGPFNDIPLSEHVQVIQTDLLGTIYGCYLALQQFRAQGFGTLINVASMIGKIPAPYYSSYAAAKHGVVGLSAALRQELQQEKLKDIHICTVMPMAMDTFFFEHAANYSGHEAKPIPPLDDAQKVIDVFIDLATHPKDEVPVGKGSGLFSFMDRLSPAATEAMMAKNTHKTQIEEAPYAPPSPGNLSQPEAKGAQVHDPKLKK